MFVFIVFASFRVSIMSHVLIYIVLFSLFLLFICLFILYLNSRGHTHNDADIIETHLEPIYQTYSLNSRLQLSLLRKQNLGMRQVIHEKRRRENNHAQRVLV